MDNKRVSVARTILIGCAAAGLAFLSGCATVTVANLTPASLPENPSEIYTFTLRVTSRSSVVVAGSIAAKVVVDGQSYAMKPSPLGNDIYEFEYQVPAGRQEIAYYYLVDYRVEGLGGTNASEVFTGVQRSQIVRRYVLSLENNRGPVGASIGVLGRGFTPQDTVSFEANPARTVYASPTSLSFFVPAVPTGHNYQVTLNSAAGNSPIGTFRVDPANVAVSPSALSLRPGESQSLTFSLSTAAPAGGLLLDVTTDVPESVIMPEVIVPAGSNTVTVPVQGGKPGSGSLVLKGYGNDLAVQVTVLGK